MCASFAERRSGLPLHSLFGELAEAGDVGEGLDKRVSLLVSHAPSLELDLQLEGRVTLDCIPRQSREDVFPRGAVRQLAGQLVVGDGVRRLVAKSRSSNYRCLSGGEQRMCDGRSVRRSGLNWSSHVHRGCVGNAPYSRGRCLCRVPLSKIFQNFFYLSYMKTINTFKPKNKVNRPGIHAKTKTSTNKNSKNYKKQYRGQGR